MNKEFMENGTLPAFPQNPLSTQPPSGLSKREWIAAMCLQGLLANKSTQNRSFWTATHSAVMYADQLLETLEEDISDEASLPSASQIPLTPASVARPS